MVKVETAAVKRAYLLQVKEIILNKIVVLLGTSTKGYFLKTCELSELKNYVDNFQDDYNYEEIVYKVINIVAEEDEDGRLYSIEYLQIFDAEL